MLHLFIYTSKEKKEKTIMMPNSNYAIVIGIDDYRIPQGSLRGAVNDAVRVWQWLIDPNGGNVPQERVLLFLSSQPSISPPLPHSYYPAKKSSFSEIIEQEFIFRKELPCSSRRLPFLRQTGHQTLSSQRHQNHVYSWHCPFSCMKVRHGCCLCITLACSPT